MMYLIKNNIKLMLRNKWSILLMILGPVLIVSVLGSAFSTLLDSYKSEDSCVVGYRSDDDILSDAAINNSSDIKWIDYPDGNIYEIISKYKLDVFVDFSKNSYKIYKIEGNEIQGMTIEYYLSRICAAMKSQIMYTDILAIADESELNITEKPFLPSVDAIQYYSMVYIVYFIWYGIVCLSSVLSSESKNRIDRRYQLGGLSDIKLFSAKWISAVIALFVEILLSFVLINIINDVQWGNYGVVFLLLFLSVAASTSLSLMLYNIFKNLAVTIGVIFSFSWFIAFTGGCFETYMFQNLSEKIKMISPLYQVNRTLVEDAFIGNSSYLASAVIYLVLITLICGVIAVLCDGLRKRGRK